MLIAFGQLNTLHYDGGLQGGDRDQSGVLALLRPYIRAFFGP